jgi:hypothetical protein
MMAHRRENWCRNAVSDKTEGDRGLNGQNFSHKAISAVKRIKRQFEIFVFSIKTNYRASVFRID